MKTIDSLNNVFNIETISKQEEIIEVKDAIAFNEKDDDFQLARQTLRGLIAKNEDVLEELVHLAKNSESPRTYEVAGQLLKTQSEIAKELMGIHKQKKDIDGDINPTKNQTNNVFIGSTSELMKLLNNPDLKTKNDTKE